MTFPTTGGPKYLLELQYRSISDFLYAVLQFFLGWPGLPSESSESVNESLRPGEREGGGVSAPVEGAPVEGAPDDGGPWLSLSCRPCPLGGLAGLRGLRPTLKSRGHSIASVMDGVGVQPRCTTQAWACTRPGPAATPISQSLALGALYPRGGHRVRAPVSTGHTHTHTNPQTHTHARAHTLS